MDRIVAASAKNPKLAIEGDTIRAILPHGQTLVTVSGPTVPPFVTPPPPVTSATFTISLSHTTGRIPLRPVDFELVDGNGRFYSPQSFDGASPPGLAPDRKTVSFQITEVMATGSGSIRLGTGRCPHGHMGLHRGERLTPPEGPEARSVRQNQVEHQGVTAERNMVSARATEPLACSSIRPASARASTDIPPR